MRSDDVRRKLEFKEFNFLVGLVGDLAVSDVDIIELGNSLNGVDEATAAVGENKSSS